MPQGDTETRRLHEIDVVERVSSFQAVLDEHVAGECVVVAPPDDRVDPFLPAGEGQQALPGASRTRSLEYPAETTSLVDTLPTTSDESYPLGTDGYRSGVLLMPPTNGYHRAMPFLDLVRAVKPGGTAVAICGLRADRSPDADAKWWVPASNQAEEVAIYAVERLDRQMMTPDVASVFTVTDAAGTHSTQAKFETGGGISSD